MAPPDTARPPPAEATDALAPLPAGGPAAEAQAAYEQYGRKGRGGVQVEELRALLADLGLLAGRNPHEAAAFVAKQFALADSKTRDSRLDFNEFTKYYCKVTAPRLLEVLAAEMPAELQQLRQVFASFACFGAPRGATQQQAGDLDGARFIKLCKETQLIGHQLATTDCDLIFAKTKGRAARRITFDQFLDALDLVAAKKGVALPAVVRQVVGAEGPATNGTTKGEWVKFHDDKTTYTGVYARGGPVVSDGPCDLAAMVSRRRSSVGGGSEASFLSASGASPTRSGGGSHGAGAGPLTPSSRCLSGGSTGGRTPCMGTPPRPAASGGSRGSRPPRPSTGEVGSPEVASRDMLRYTFRAFASFGQGSSPVPPKARTEMDSRQFMKLCRDSRLLGGQLTSMSIDLAFTKAKQLGARKICFKEFLAAVELLALVKGVQTEELTARIASCAGPSMHGVVVPEAVRLHDDTSQYTGVCARGAPAVAAPAVGTAALTPPAAKMASRINVINISVTAAY